MSRVVVFEFGDVRVWVDLHCHQNKTPAALAELVVERARRVARRQDVRLVGGREIGR